MIAVKSAFSIGPHNTVQYNTIQYNTIQYNTIRNMALLLSYCSQNQVSILFYNNRRGDTAPGHTCLHNNLT